MSSFLESSLLSSASVAVTTSTSTSMAASSAAEVGSAGEGFAQALQSVASEGAQVAKEASAQVQQSAAQSYLLPADSALLGVGKPSMAQFMKATGATVAQASSALYGVVGSNADLRDWPAIMASGNPLQAAREAVGAMYRSDLDFAAPGALPLQPEQVLAQSGNFAWVKTQARENLTLVDAQGHALRQLPLHEADIAQAAQDFGFGLQDLQGLADQLDALGVKYQPGAVFTGSGFGVDLRAMGLGAAGTAGAVQVADAAPAQSLPLQLARAWQLRAAQSEEAAFLK